MIKTISIYFFCVSFIYISSGCFHNYDNKKENRNIFLSLSDSSIRIPIDAQTYPQSGCSFAYNSKMGVSYLVYLNKRFNEIHFYYINSLKLAFKVKIDLTGPNGVGSKINGFWVHDIDSIYITPKARKIIFLINKKDEIIEKIKYDNYSSNLRTKDKINRMMAFYSNTKTPLIILNHNLYISMLPGGNWNNYSKEELTKTELTFSLNPINKQLNVLPITYPLSAFNSNNLGYSRIFADGRFVYSFNSDHNLYVTKDHSKINKHIAKSSYISSFERNPKNVSLQDIFLKQCSTPAYIRIIYDPYRKVYYRIAYPGVSVNKNDNLRELIKYIPVFSIIILDQDFTKIGETMMPENKFNVSDIFVAKEGLYVSENHIKNPAFNPDFLTFRLLSLVNYEK